MNDLFIVPARGGSARFEDKNIALLDEQPLIYHTLDAVTEIMSNSDTIVFSTDSTKIMRVAKRHKFKDKIKYDFRPPNLATRESKVIDTVIYYFLDIGHKYDKIWLLLPTCPLRTTRDIEEARMFLSPEYPEYDGVVSVTNYEFPPTLGLELRYKSMIKDWHESEPWQNGNTRSQDHPTIYRPNGAVYGMWTKSFKKYENFYKGNVYGYYMPRERSVDIDTRLDLKVAEVLMNEKKNIL